MSLAALLMFGLVVLTEPVVVVEGDRFDAGGVRYGVADLDAPETNGRCPAERALARLATAEARAAFATASTVTVEVVDVQPATARFRERLVARVSLDGQDLATRLVEADVARWDRDRGRWCETIRE